MLNQKFINQFERIFKCCFCFFHDKRIEKYMYCVKIQIEYFFPLWCMFVISNSVLNVLCILYSSCAIVIDMLITLQAVQLCDQ